MAASSSLSVHSKSPITSSPSSPAPSESDVINEYHNVSSNTGNSEDETLDKTESFSSIPNSSPDLSPPEDHLQPSNVIVPISLTEDTSYKGHTVPFKTQSSSQEADAEIEQFDATSDLTIQGLKLETDVSTLKEESVSPVTPKDEPIHEPQSISQLMDTNSSPPYQKVKSIRRKPVPNVSIAEPPMEQGMGPPLTPELPQYEQSLQQNRREVSNSESISPISPRKAENLESSMPHTRSPYDDHNGLEGSKEAKEDLGYPPPLPPKDHKAIRSSKPAYRNSIQLPPTEFFKEPIHSRPLNPHTSTKSFSRARPLSYIEYQSQPLDWQQYENRRASNVPILKGPITGSIATGVPTFTLLEPPHLGKQLRYHIMKSPKDLYMTTNPDFEHMHCPAGPSYYVDIIQAGPNNSGHLGFSLSFIDPTKRYCEMMVTRLFTPNDEEYFDVISFKNPNAKPPQLFDFSQPKPLAEEIYKGEDMVNLARQVYNSTGGVQVSSAKPEVAWRGRAMPRFFTGDDSNGSKMSGKKSSPRQFTFQDNRGRMWIIGSRNDIQEGPQHSYEDDEDDEGGKRVKRDASNIYCFMPGPGGPETDKIVAVLQHAKAGKTIKKDSNKRGNSSRTSSGEQPELKGVVDYEVEGASPKRRGFFKSGSHVRGSVDSSGGGVGGGYNLGGISHIDGAEEDDDIAAKFGWLTISEDVKTRPGMWLVSIALTLAVAYDQPMDVKDKSMAEKFKRLGRKYREGRMQVFYGHRYNQSLA